MGFKADTSFLRFLTMGALGVRRTMDQLRTHGFEPIELERYCGSNKIWATKVKRLRLADVLCVRTGLRVEVRAKSDLKIRMSDAPDNPERTWDAGLRDDDVVAFIACVDSDDGPVPDGDAVFFNIRSLRASVGSSTLGPPKSASEGAERDRTWPAIVPSRAGSVLTVTADKLVVLMDANAVQSARRQTYTLRGKRPYVSVNDRFNADISIIAGAPDSLADLAPYRARTYDPISATRDGNPVDRYAAVKALGHRADLGAARITALEQLLRGEAEERVMLEAAGVAGALGSPMGQEIIERFIWRNEARKDLRMEAVLILTEHGDTEFSRNQLTRIASAAEFEGDELRQAAVWGLGKNGLRRYADLLAFIADREESVALHAVAAFAPDAPAHVIDSLIREMLSADPRRAPAASEILRIIGSKSALDALIAAHRAAPADWLLATIARFPIQQVRSALAGDPLLITLSPFLLTAQGANWLANDTTQTDIRFLLKQNL